MKALSGGTASHRCGRDTVGVGGGTWGEFCGRLSDISQLSTDIAQSKTDISQSAGVVWC